MLQHRYTSRLGSEVPRRWKHVPCNPLNCTCKLVRRTSSSSRPVMAQKRWGEAQRMLDCCGAALPAELRGRLNPSQ